MPIVDQSIVLLRVLIVLKESPITSSASTGSLENQKKHEIDLKNERIFSFRSTRLRVLNRCVFIRSASHVAFLISCREYPRFFKTCKRSRDDRLSGDLFSIRCRLAAQCSDFSKESKEYLRSVLMSQSSDRGAPRDTDGLSPKHNSYSLNWTSRNRTLFLSTCDESNDMLDGSGSKAEHESSSRDGRISLSSMAMPMLIVVVLDLAAIFESEESSEVLQTRLAFSWLENRNKGKSVNALESWKNRFVFFLY